MKMRGKPEGLIRKTVVNRHDSEKDEEITLQYKYYEMRYYGFSKRALSDPPKSRLMAVLSKDMGSYLYSIEPGMVKAKVLAILGIEATGKGTVEFSNEKGHWAILIFEDEKLSRIIWDYSRE